MGLKPNEQNEEQAPGEGSNRAARLGFIVLVQAHYWQGQSAYGEPTLRNLAAANWGTKRRPFGRRDGTNRGRLDQQQGSRLTGLSDGPSQASSSARPRRGTSATQRPPTPGPRRPWPPQPRASRLAIQNSMPQPPAAARKTHPPERKGRPRGRLAQPLRRVTRSTAAAVACGQHNCAPPQRDPLQWAPPTAAAAGQKTCTAKGAWRRR